MPSTVIAFIGAGSVEFTQDLLTDLSTWDADMEMTWRLHDIDAERLEVAVGVAERLRADRGLRAVVESHHDRATALDGADALVVTVMIGGLEATRADLEIPLRHGLRQTIGDTLGVGGIFRGLRTAGFYADLAADVRRLCPNAWILNYTNPMAINIGYLDRIAPDLNVLGLCHSVHWTMDTLSGIVGVPLDEMTFTAAGVNHQSWVLKWERDGQDLYPLLDERIARRPRTPPAGPSRHVPPTRKIPHRVQRAQRRVRRLVPPTLGADRAFPADAGGVRRDQRGERQGVSPHGRGRAAGNPDHLRNRGCGVCAAGHPRLSDRHRTRHLRHRSQPGLDRQPPRRRRGRGARHRRRRRSAPPVRSAHCRRPARP